MSEYEFNKEDYLKRINYQGKVSNDLDCLKSILHGQHRSIPFENFDICLGKEINLAPNALAEKLVDNKRGGYCFELNGLLLMALKSFGFDARALLGRVHLTRKPTGRTHQVSLINLNGQQYIVDLGFGSETPPIPIPLIINQPTTFKNQTFRIIESECYGFMLQINNIESWKNLYSFDLNHVYPCDIELGSYYAATNQHSIFVIARVAALPVENGIITLYDDNLKKTINGVQESIYLDENQSYIDILKKEFGIELDAKYEELKPLKDYF
jgi:N-hydroxyarylamine O-acetyltransferase